MSFAGGCAVAVTPLRATLKGQQGLLCVGQDELKDAATGWMPPAANVSTENNRPQPTTMPEMMGINDEMLLYYM